jgi:hypothetical protein
MEGGREEGEARQGIRTGPGGLVGCQEFPSLQCQHGMVW